ncbi:hypothetical protein LTR66_007653 [Elasticomyces elasticus]|nr:hypothetical protein LTR66_007653 [Elasticomyces elasticus]
MFICLAEIDFAEAATPDALNDGVFRGYPDFPHSLDQIIHLRDFTANLANFIPRHPLEEFDRRVRRTKAGIKPKSTTPPKRILRSSRSTKQLAKGGGPDLTFLRGAGTLYITTDCLWLILGGEQYSSRDVRAAGTISESTSQRRERSAGSRSSLGSTSTATGSSRGRTQYDPNFDQAMIDGGVYPDGYGGANGTSAPTPNNMEEILRSLGQQRASLSPSQFSEGAFANFERANRLAKGEAAAMAEVIPVIAGQRDR